MTRPASAYPLAASFAAPGQQLFGGLMDRVLERMQNPQRAFSIHRFRGVVLDAIGTRAPFGLGTVNRGDVGNKCVERVFSHLPKKPGAGRFLERFVVDYNHLDVRLEQKIVPIIRIGKFRDDPGIAHPLGNYLHDRFVARKNRNRPTLFARAACRVRL